MTRILQCLVWITVMAGSANTQRGSYSYWQSGRITFPDTEPHNKYPSQENLDNLDHRTVRIKNRASLETNHLAKRGGHHKLLTKFFTELLAALGAIDVEDRVVFPGETAVSVPEECKGLGYCLLNHAPAKSRAHTAGVIDRVIKSAIDKYGNADIVKERFQSDELDQTVEITQRFGGNTFNLCNASEKVITPGILQDTHQRWYSVAQDEANNFLQRFRVEICNTNTEETCDGRISLPRTFSSRCVQHFAYRVVWVAIDDKMIQKSLKLPTCCSCQIYET